MTCEFITAKDGTRLILCTSGRPRLKKCATCGLPGALLCDGCDRPLCRACAVSSATEQDFCPKCFGPVFKSWLSEHPEAATASQEVRRRVFRMWVREHPESFDAIHRTSEGLAARALGCAQDAGERKNEQAKRLEARKR